MTDIINMLPSDGDQTDKKLDIVKRANNRIVLRLLLIATMIASTVIIINVFYLKIDIYILILFYLMMASFIGCYYIDLPPDSDNLPVESISTYTWLPPA